MRAKTQRQRCEGEFPFNSFIDFLNIKTFEFKIVKLHIHSFNLAPDEDLLIRSKYRALLFNQDVRNYNQIRTNNFIKVVFNSNNKDQ